MNNNANKRTRNWTGIFYPESCAENWEEIIEKEIMTPVYVSPLHHGFSDGKLDEDKKDHYHILLVFDGVKSREQVLNIVEPLGVVMVQAVDNLKCMARYLCHLDDPDKEQFKNLFEQLKCFHTNIEQYISMCEMPEDRLDCIGQMLDYVQEQNVVSFFDLLMYARYNNKEWFRSLCSNSSYIMVQAIKSNSWQLENVGMTDYKYEQE